jgi:hypothetical protein
MKYAEKLFKEMCKTGADSVTFEDAKTNTTFRFTLERLKFVKTDPYAHLKEAQARGEIIQVNLDYYCLGEKTFWIDKAKNVNFIGEPDRYRIKPKTKTLYKFAYLDEKTKSWKNTDVYHQTVVSARADILWAVEFKRLDYTAIEVEA